MKTVLEQLENIQNSLCFLGIKFWHRPFFPTCIIYRTLKRHKKSDLPTSLFETARLVPSQCERWVKSDLPMSVAWKSLRPSWPGVQQCLQVSQLKSQLLIIQIKCHPPSLHKMVWLISHVTIRVLSTTSMCFLTSF